MKIETQSAELRTLAVRLIARSVAFTKINSNWSLNDLVDGAARNFGDWFDAEVKRLIEERQAFHVRVWNKIVSTFKRI